MLKIFVHTFYKFLRNMDIYIMENLCTSSTFNPCNIFTEMASSRNTTCGMGKSVLDYSNLNERIVEDKYVVFTITQDPKALEILDLIRENGLERLCSINVPMVMQYEVMEFFRNLRVTSNGLISIVRGKEILISNSDLRRIFRLPSEGNTSPLVY